MSSAPRSDDVTEIQEAAEEEEVLKLEQEVEKMAEKIVDYRTTLSSSLLESQMPVLPIHLLNDLEPKTPMIPAPDSDAATSQGLVREMAGFAVMGDSDEAEKIQVLKQKISSNVTAMPIVLNRMRGYLGRIDKLDSSIGIIHPAFKSKPTR